MEYQRRPHDGYHGLDELHLTHLRDGSDRESSIPGNKPEEHTHHSEVGECGPLGRSCIERLLIDCDDHQEHHKRRRDDECPGDGLPRSELAREHPAFGIADRRGDDSAKEEQIGEIELAYFGLFAEFRRQGLGSYLLDWAIQQALSYQPERLWVHTCELDHPAALPTYLKAGFQIYLEQVIDQPLPDQDR